MTADRAPLQVSAGRPDAGSSAADPIRDPPSPPWRRPAASPSIHRSPSSPCRSPTPTSFARPARRSEKSAPRRSTPCPAGAATIVDVREDVRVGAGPPARRPHVSKSYIEQQIEGVAPDRDAPVDPVLRRRRPLAVRGPDAGRDGLHRTSPRCPAASRPGRAPASSSTTPVVLTAEQKQRYSRHLLIPEVGVGRPGAAARLEGAAHRRRRARLAGVALPRGRRRRHDRHRRLRRRRPVSNLQRQIVHTTDRVGERKVESAQKTINALNPDVKVVPHEEMLVAANVERIIAGYDVILDGTDTFETRYILNDAAVAAGHPGRPRQRLPVRGPADHVRPVRRAVLSLPLPDPAAARARARLLRGRRPRRRARDPRPAPGERGAQGPARDRRHAGRPAAPVRCPRDRVHRAQAAARPELPGLLRRRRRGARGRRRRCQVDGVDVEAPFRC